MDKAIIFTDTINTDNVKKCIDTIQEWLIASKDNTVTLYFESTGGYLPSGALLSNFLEAHKERIKLIGFGDLFSTAFLVLYNFSGRKKVLADAMGMVHHTDSDVSYRNITKHPKGMGNIIIGDVKYMNNAMLEEFSKFLSPDEIARFTEGEEVYISYPTMEKLINQGQVWANKNWFWEQVLT